MSHTRFAITTLMTLACSLLGSCASPPSPYPDLFVGESKLVPIEVCKPQGQRAYLARLVCRSGQAPAFNRAGNVGPREDFRAGMTDEQKMAAGNKMIRFEPLRPDELHFHIVDKFELTCGDSRTFLYLDMYHCEASPPTVAPRGYLLKD